MPRVAPIPAPAPCARVTGVSTARPLTAYAWLSISAAVGTMAVKSLAWAVTGSVGILADAAESLVNLAAGVVALIALRIAAVPPDEDHAHGHEKAEYFAAGVEGMLIFGAAVSIGAAAVGRLLDPAPLEHVAAGLLLTSAASVVNLGAGFVLVRAGRRHRSIVLEADGRHLLADVWTSLGVLAGVAAAAVSGWRALDPLVALAVAVNIVVVGWGLVGRSVGGLMDRSLPASELALIEGVLGRYTDRGVSFHALRTRQAGRRSFLSVHVLVPGRWTVQQGHDLLEGLEADLRAAVPSLSVDTHLEPIEDPVSFADQTLDRRRPG